VGLDWEHMLVAIKTDSGEIATDDRKDSVDYQHGRSPAQIRGSIRIGLAMIYSDKSTLAANATHLWRFARTLNSVSNIKPTFTLC
jgi:hypothetical protein